MTRPPTHPRDFLNDVVLPEASLDQRAVVEGAFAGTRDVTPEIAAKLRETFGSDGGLFLRMQQAYDEWKAKNT